MTTLPDRYTALGAEMKGGMSSVLMCSDNILERKVAIKFIHSTTHRRRMLDELAALLKLRSKHVVQVYDILGIEKDDIGIVQEFIDGEDLFESHVVPTEPAAYYKQLWQIASGISDIHELGVIHRDIKPNNMKMDPEGVIKIFDFGLARDDGPGASTVGFVGTQGFAAPELYTGAVRFTTAIDTYAFGAMALFLATGSLPAELMEAPPRHLSAGYFSALPLVLASEVADALNACLATAPEDRPSMPQIRDLLSRHILFNRHQALVVFQGKASYLNAASPTVSLNLPPIGQIRIRYNGLDFVVESFTGEVSINNAAIQVGEVLPGACVVALGAGHRRANERKFITFDISHPEIVL